MSTEGYVRVIAGAGSGKTRALAYRFAYLVDELGIAPNRIMAVTFTNKAAGVMKNRIRQLIGDQDTAYINTFHGFCVRVLREDIYNVNYPQNFVVMDVEDQKSIFSEIYEDIKIVCTVIVRMDFFPSEIDPPFIVLNCFKVCPHKNSRSAVLYGVLNLHIYTVLQTFIMKLIILGE